MSSGELTNILVSTDVTRYLEFKQVAGSYVQQGSGPKATVAKVPSDAAEALRSPLMGIFEKRRMKGFIEWVGSFNTKHSATHKGASRRSKRWTRRQVCADRRRYHRSRRRHLHHARGL